MANKKKNSVLFYIAIIIVFLIISFTFFELSKQTIEKFNNSNKKKSLEFDGYVKFYYFKSIDCNDKICKIHDNEWDKLLKKIKENQHESQIYTHVISESENQQSYKAPSFMLALGYDQNFVYNGKISAEEILRFIINTSNKYRK